MKAKQKLKRCILTLFIAITTFKLLAYMPLNVKSIIMTMPKYFSSEYNTREKLNNTRQPVKRTQMSGVSHIITGNRSLTLSSSDVSGSEHVTKYIDISMINI